jgi:cytochrome P450
MTELPNRAGSTLGPTDPPRHNRLRGLVQHAFLKRNLEALGGPMRDDDVVVAAAASKNRARRCSPSTPSIAPKTTCRRASCSTKASSPFTHSGSRLPQHPL